MLIFAKWKILAKKDAFFRFIETIKQINPIHTYLYYLSHHFVSGCLDDASPAHFSVGRQMCQHAGRIVRNFDVIVDRIQKDTIKKANGYNCSYPHLWDLYLSVSVLAILTIHIRVCPRIGISEVYFFGISPFLTKKSSVKNIRHASEISKKWGS